MALVATPGASNANSYLTVVEADAYIAGRLHAGAWETDTTVKESALIMATRLIDAHVCFVGSASTSTQALAWPRTGMVNRNGFPIPSTEIPQALKDATAELAFLLISTDTTVPTDASAQGLKRVKAGSVEIEFKDGEFTITAIPASVTSLLPGVWLCDEDESDELMFEVV